MSGGDRDRLSGQDVSFLARADRGAPLNVAGLIRLRSPSRPLDLVRARELVLERLGPIPRLRQRPVIEDSAVVWADDPVFDIRRHVDELTVTAGDPSLLGEIARLHTTSLDPAHPLWALSVVGADERRGPALLFRASHALVDGMSSMQVMRRLFDPLGDASARRRGTGRDPASAASAGRPERLEADAFDIVRDLWRTMRPRDRLELGAEEYEQAITLLDGWISMLERGWRGGPRLASNRPIRCRVVLIELDSAALRSLRRDLAVRFDVIGLTIAAAALGRLFDARGESTRTPIRTLVPVAVAGRSPRDDLGNRASFVLVNVPIGPMEPLERLRQVNDEIGAALAAGQHRAAAMTMRALESAPGDSVWGVPSSAASGHFVDLVVSCVPGSRRPITFDGIPHDVTHPILPITPQMRLAIGFGDIAGRLGVAITADERVLPEVDFLADAIGRSAAALSRPGV